MLPFDVRHHDVMRALSLNLAAVICCSAVTLYAVDVVTYHNDNARTGWNSKETVLTLANVNSTTFGKLFTLSAEGKVDAEPLYVSGVAIPGQGVHNVLIVSSEHDTV